MLKLRFKPIIQEAARCSVIMGAGDVIAQTLVEKKSFSDIDVVRTVKFGSVGFFFVGPTLRVWYTKLDQMVSSKQKPLIRALKKTSIDQILFAPIFTAAIIGLIGKVNHESNAQINERLRTDYPHILLRNYMLWPAAQMINFYFVPIAYQVIFEQFVAVLWNTYISMVLNKH